MRLDVYLVEKGFFPSRSAAQTAISGAHVVLDGKTADKASFKVDESLDHTVRILDSCPYVSRGGLKLEHALALFRLDPEGKTCLDIGASTGGFTDCLLKKGAKFVYAVDVGSNQLNEKIRNDTRVSVREKYNARYMKKDDFDSPVQWAVMDVSFISQTLLLGPVYGVLEDSGILVTLIKPQFEVGKNRIGKNGIVKEPDFRLEAVSTVQKTACQRGFSVIGLGISPIPGGDGNLEYLLALQKSSAGRFAPETVLRELVYENQEVPLI